ncbi:MAG TPA: aldose epimerase family protein, partial [Solirubrobacteraceae bacterium]
MGKVAIHEDAIERLERDENRKENWPSHWRRLARRVAVSGGVVGIATVLALGSGATAASHGRASRDAGLRITSEPFGTVPAHPPLNQALPARLYTLSNGHRMIVKITNYGGIVQSIWVPDRKGGVKNVVLGFRTLADYVKDFTNPPPGGSGNTYFGAIIGRYANRIANGQFTLNGTTYHLPQNNGPNTLHGGPNAFNTQVWDATVQRGRHSVGLRLTYTDPAGYNGFPGAVTVVVTYTLTAENALRIEYHATTTAPTVINLTNHSYFNLAGEGSGDVYGQLLRINAARYTPVNATLIPTGELARVAGTPFDFRSLKPIGQDIRNAGMPGGNQLVIAHGYDHNWVLDGSGLKLASVALDPGSGRVLKTYTTEPGVQFYSGNFMVGDLVGTSGHTYRQTDGFTLETQH